MANSSSPTPPADDRGQRQRGFQPGDQVVPVQGHPVLCEVLRVEADGLIRIRGLEWPPGYSVVARAEDYKRVTGPLAK